MSGGQKRNFFVKMHKTKYVFPEGFPPGGAATHRRVFCLDFFRMFSFLLRMFIFLACLDFLGMFRLFWECLDFVGNV